VSEGLDFTGLTDDQLVELAAALAYEALHRGAVTAQAFEQALETEKERFDAQTRAAQFAEQARKRSMDEIRKRAAQEQAREELRQQQRTAMAVFVRGGAHLVGRSVNDVTLVWTSSFTANRGHRLYLNAGTTGNEVTWHLVDYCPGEESIRVGWALQKHKPQLLQWAREAAAATRALGLDSITIKGIDL